MKTDRSHSQFVIRRLIAADIESVVTFSLRAWAPNFASCEEVLGSSLYRKVYPNWLESQRDAVAGVCVEEKNLVWVCTADNTPIAFVAVIVTDKNSSAEIEMLAVDPEFQGRGIAGDLISHAVAQITELGISLVEIATGGDIGHAAARRAYEKAGFTPLPLVRYYKLLS